MDNDKVVTRSRYHIKALKAITPNLAELAKFQTG